MAKPRDLPREPRLGTAAWIPQGALLFNGVILQVRMLGATKVAAERRLYGRLRASSNLFGLDADAVAERLFAGQVSGREVLIKHSLFGFYRHFLDGHQEQELGARLARGDGNATAEYLPRTLLTGGFGTALRHCTKCLEDDLQEQGVPVWRCYHQVLFVQRCHLHKCTLISKCRGCGALLQTGLNVSLPGDACFRCGTLTKSRDVEGSMGQASIAAQSAALCLQPQSRLDPYSWAGVVDLAVSELGGLHEAVRLFEQTIARRWNVSSLAALRRLFAGHLAAHFIGDELQNLAGASEVGGRLIVRDALVDLLGPERFLEIERSSALAREKSSTASVEKLGARAGVPIGAVRCLAAGLNVRDSANFANVGYAKLRRFVVSLAGTVDNEQDEVASFIVGRLVDPTGRRREASRAKVVQWIEGGAPLVRGVRGPIGRHVAYLHRHDATWLEGTLPYKITTQPSRDDETREAYRNEVLAFKKTNPESPLTAGLRRSWPAIRWLYVHDLDWLNAAFAPQRRPKYRDASHKRSVFRAAVREWVRAQRSQDVTRSKAKAALGGTWNYLTRHDRQWTLRQIPKSIAGP